METTLFRHTPERGLNTKGQYAIYAAAAVVSLALIITGMMAARARASQPVRPVDPHSFGAGLSEVFESWKRDVLHTAPTPAPVSAIQPAQVQQPTPAQVAQVQPVATPEPPTDAMMAEWRHVPRGQEENYAAYERRLAAQQVTPAPTPYLAPEVAATPDPIAVRYANWKSLHDGYVTQVRARVQAARTDAEKGQIQRDIATWKAANPEPPKPASTPGMTAGGYEEIPIK